MFASELFKDKKDSYPASVGVPFIIDRLSENEIFKKMPKFKQDIVKNKAYVQDANEKLIVKFEIKFSIFVTFRNYFFI